MPRADGEKVPCLFLPFRHARFIIIYFHANAEDLGLCYTFCTIIRDLFQVHMLAVEYPGYGICPGHCCEDGIMANASAALTFAMETLRWPCDGIKLLGRSLGTGPAVSLAAQYDVAGVILVTPFLSIREIFKAQVGGLADFVADRFPNYKLAGKIESPTLIIHGQQDTLIPISHSKRIYEAVPAKKMMVCPAAMAHNTSLLANVGAFVLPMTQFFSLPDYTFEDIEVPEWVFPDSNMEELEPATKKEEEDQNGWVCGPASNQWLNLMTPRDSRRGRTEWRPPGHSELRGSASTAPKPGAKVPPLKLPGADPQTNEGPGQLSASHAKKPPSSKLTQPLRESPRPRQNDLMPEPSTLKVSRNYDFASPSCTPRDRDATDQETQETRVSKKSSHDSCDSDSSDDISAGDVANEVQNNRVVFSEEMLHAIKNGIEWLVDTESDVGMLGATRKGSSPSPLSPLRGAPELRSRVAHRLSSSSLEPKKQIQARLPKTAAGDEAVHVPEDRMPSYADPSVVQADPSTAQVAVDCQNGSSTLGAAVRPSKSAPMTFGPSKSAPPALAAPSPDASSDKGVLESKDATSPDELSRKYLL